MKILIANRGEIARRIERTCTALGFTAVGVFVEGDAGSVNAVRNMVTVPSYLDQQAIVAAAQTAGADAVHPGYGFLAENADFAQAVLDAGLIWIGPRPAVIAQMGSKINAREIAEQAGVPLIPGYAESQDDGDLAAAAERIGFPVLVKASAGGGGKGIRIASSAADFAQALSEARTEADRSFGDDSVIVERYVERPRHIEVQVIGDSHGAIYHLGTRECSVQRRYQKLFEEAPAPNLPDATRSGLHDAAVKLAQAVDYDSAGTVEFIVDDETGDFFFLEMNTRLQVEHPVTENITGLDLVELMLLVAQGLSLPDLRRVAVGSHSIEVRITAEDPWSDFAPSAGTVSALSTEWAPRWDSVLEVGTVVEPTYDSMIAKLITHGRDRDLALSQMRTALDHLIIGGLDTSAGFHRWLVDQPAVIEGRVTTRLLDEIELPAPPEPDVHRAAQLADVLGRELAEATVWTNAAGFSVTSHASKPIITLRDADGEIHEYALDFEDQLAELPTAGWAYARNASSAPTTIAFNVDGHTQTFDVVDRTEAWAPTTGARTGTGNALVAPFPAAVTEVVVAAGDEITGEQVLVVIEAMKMLHSLKADGAATVDQVLVAVGDQVTSGQPLVTFVSPIEEEDSP